jgi:hypothetical protein
MDTRANEGAGESSLDGGGGGGVDEVMMKL